MPGLGQRPGDPVCDFSSPLRGGLRWGLQVFNIFETPSLLSLRGGGIKSGDFGNDG